MADQSFYTAPTRPMSRQSHGRVCTECRRQKQKCDRQTPCSNCARRRIPQLCRTSSQTAPSQAAARVRRDAPPDGTVRPVQRQSVAETPAEHGHGHENAQTSSHGSPRASLPTASSSRIGYLWNFRGAPSYHGSSYFGHHAAGDLIHADTVPAHRGSTSLGRINRHRDVLSQSRRGEKGLYTHIWDLVSHLPRKKSDVDTLVSRFMGELNSVYDSLHEDTFKATYDAFWDRKWGDDDLTAVDLRWLSLLFMVLAFGELLECPPACSVEIQAEHEAASVHYFWAARKTLVIAPTFSGESPDLVRAGILVSRYLVYLGRKNESWLTCSFAVRMAQGQGMHIDGESWGLPPKVLETRRRVWGALYAFDRSVSLAIGRPYAITDKHCMRMRIRNIWVDDTPNDEAWAIEERPLHDPTPSAFYMYQQDLASLMGHIHDECFGLSPIDGLYNTYEKVLRLDRALVDWAEALPPYFAFSEPDTNMDLSRPYIVWQRIYLHSGYHFARVTLHRPFLFPDSITDQYKNSREICIESACADLSLKLGLKSLTMGDRLRAGAAMYNLFNSALVFGIIAVRHPRSPQTAAILQDLADYCEKQNADSWSNEVVLAEVRVIELCIANARRLARNDRETQHTPAQTDVSHIRETAAPFTQPRIALPSAGDACTDASDGPGRMELGAHWLDAWLGPTWQFPEPLDYHLWEDLVESLQSRS